MKFAQANKEVGTVQNLDGKFYVKDEDGNVIELKNGDVIEEGMVIIGDKGNLASAKVEIVNGNSTESIVVSGDQEQSFDASFVEGFTNESKDVSESLEDRFEEIKDRLDSVSKSEVPQEEVRENNFEKPVAVEVKPSQSIAMDDYYQATEDGTEYDIKEDIVDTVDNIDDSKNVSGNLLSNDNNFREIVEEPAPVIQKKYDNKVVIDNDLEDNDKVRTKSDNDEVIVEGDVEDKARINTGSGDDKVTIEGDVEDKAKINTGSGNDEVVVGDDLENRASLKTGSGDDKVTIEGDVEDKAKINTGSGDDKVTIEGDLEDSSSLKTGSGEDEVVIKNLDDKAKIDLGSDDDKLTIKDKVETKDSFVNGGSGDDKLVLENKTQDDWDNGVKDRFINFEEVTFSDGNTISLVDANSKNMNITSITIDGVKYDVDEDNTEIVLSHGTITISPNGDFNYIVDNSNSEVQELNIGDSLNEVFSYTLSDGIHSSTATVTIAIDGRDDAPVIESILVNENDLVETVLFTEDFEGVDQGQGDANISNGWYVDHGSNGDDVLVSNSGNKWTMNEAGIEMRDNGVVHGLKTADNSDTYVEMDAHTRGTNSSLTTTVDLGDNNSSFNLSFNFIPRPGSEDTSDMKFSLDNQEVILNVDASGNITYDTGLNNIDITITKVDGSSWYKVEADFSGIDKSSAELNFQSIGNADTLGAYVDAVKLVGISSSSTEINNSIFDDITISDVDDTNLEGASIALVNYQEGDSINIGDLPDGITANIVGASVELSGTASIADYESALKSLTFETTSSDSSSREFVFSVFDGDKHSEAQSITIEVSPNQTVSGVLVEEDFEGGATGWSDNITTNLGGELTEFLGRFGGTDGKEGVSKTFNLGIENAGKIVDIEFDMFELDSWDGSNDFNRIAEDGKIESFQVFVNGSKMADDEYDAFTSDEIGNSKDDSDGGKQVGNLSYDANGGWGDKDSDRANNEEIHHYVVQARVDANGEVKLGFGSTLNQEIDDESFGIDNIKISHSNNIDGNHAPIAISDNTITTEDNEVLFDHNYINVWGNPISQDNFTISLELTPIDTEDGFRAICGIQKGSDVDGRSPTLYQVGSRIKYDSVDEDGNHYSEYIGDVLQDGESVHITWVKEGTEYRFYQDGDLIHTSEAPEIVHVNDNYYFGQASGKTFNGSMDNIQLYSKALTQEEVIMTSKGMVADSNSLSLHYDFEGDKPWSDKSDNDFNAHPVGDPKPEIISKSEVLEIEVSDNEAITIESSQLLINDLDLDGDNLYIIDVSATQNTYGTVSMNVDGNIVYTPNGVHNGRISFEYTISDGKGGIDTASVNINVINESNESQNIHVRNVEYHSDIQNSTDYDDYIEAELITGSANDTIIVEDDIGDENDYIDGHGGARTIDTGAGDDVLAVGGDIQHGATVNTGAGDDKIIVGDSDYLDLDLDNSGSIEAEASINTGAGNDYLSADLLSDSSVDMGDGNDTLALKRVAGDSNIETGAGDDKVTLNDVSSGFDDGSVNLGSGDDQLTIDDTLAGTDAIFDGGEGEDTLVLNNVTREEWDNGVKDNFVNFEHVVLNNLGHNDETETNQISLDVNLSDDTTNIENTTQAESTYRARPDMLEDIEDVTNTLAQSTDTIHEFGDMNDALYTEQNDDIDVIEVDGNSNTIMTYGGDDIINVDGNQNRAIDAGDGNNRIDIDGNSNSIYVQDGDDNVRIAGNQNKGIDLNDGNNQIDVLGNASNIYTGSGNDVINIGENANKNIGTEAGDDYVTIGGNSSKVDLGAGNDIIEIGGNVNRYVNGGDGVDTIILNNYSKADWDSNVGNIQNNVMNFENIKFNDGEIIGDSSAFSANNSTTTFYTTLSIVATQTVSSEAMDNVEIEIPNDVSVNDANGNELTVTNGVVSLPITSGAETSITLISEERLTQDELDSIQDSAVIPGSENIDNDDVFDLADGIDFDFSDDNLENLHDISEIDMHNDSANSIEGITLDDILEMTDDNNTLTITGDDNDSLDISTDGWTQNGPTITDTDSGMTTYEYANSSGDIITLNIDEQIHSTGM